MIVRILWKKLRLDCTRHHKPSHRANPSCSAATSNANQGLLKGSMQYHPITRQFAYNFHMCILSQEGDRIHTNNLPFGGEVKGGVELAELAESLDLGVPASRPLYLEVVCNTHSLYLHAHF